jgi:hypothetical protein
MQTEAITIVGIDCATDDAKIGIARGLINDGRVVLDEAEACSRSRTASDVIGDLVASSHTRHVLLAIDAPLGWPAPLGRMLINHTAGSHVPAEANLLFRRTTDVFIKNTLGQTPLDVGADRIARTAHAALGLLNAVRQRLQVPLRLAWNVVDLVEPSVIEVYPAATLLAHRIRSKGYKKPQQVAERSEIITALTARIQIPGSVATALNNPDCLDAAVCVLAGADFVTGRAVGPKDQSLAMREGWIWAAKREG